MSSEPESYVNDLMTHLQCQVIRSKTVPIEVSGTKPPQTLATPYSFAVPNRVALTGTANRANASNF